LLLSVVRHCKPAIGIPIALLQFFAPAPCQNAVQFRPVFSLLRAAEVLPKHYLLRKAPPSPAQNQDDWQYDHNRNIHPALWCDDKHLLPLADDYSTLPHRPDADAEVLTAAKYPPLFPILAERDHGPAAREKS